VTTDTRLWSSWLRVQRLLPIATFVFLTTTTPAWPHSGGLDAYGCHHDRKRGGYQRHRGESAGRSFVSKDEMLQQLRARPGPAAPRATPPPSRDQKLPSGPEPSLLTSTPSTWSTVAAASLTAASMGRIVWISCDCGAKIARRVIEEEAR
jgi:hypothetical protein